MDGNSEQCSKSLKSFSSPSLPKKGFVYVSMVALLVPYIIPSSWFIKTPCVSCTVMNAMDSYSDAFSKIGQSCGADVALLPFITARKKAGSPRPSRSPKGERLAGSSSPELHISKPRHASDPGSSPGSQQSLSGVDGDIKQAFGEQDHTGTRNLRNDLLHAADSVTSAMSSLVKELNSVISELDLYRAKLCRSTDYNNVTYFLRKDLEDNSNFTEKNGIVEDPELKTLELEVNKMTESLELDKRIRHKARDNLTNGDVTNNGAAAVIVHAPYKKPKHQNDSLDSLPRGGHVTDDESYIQTDDDEGTIRTDDEELEWQESMKRWANR